VVLGEVLGSVDERSLTEKIFHGEAKLTDSVSSHMGPKLPLVGSLESVGTARERLDESDTIMVTFAGAPVGILTRHDLLTYMSS
jgi:cystathionine beta-synthase